MRWNEAVKRMDAANFKKFGEHATINDQDVTVVKEDNFDEFGAMQANTIRLCIQKAAGILPRKGDQVIYQNRIRTVADVPQHEDELIYFNLKNG